MSLSPALFIELLALGCACGFLAGMLGIGGGMLLVPALTFIASHEGFPADRVVKMAVATSLATILFTSVSSVKRAFACLLFVLAAYMASKGLGG
jgi:uncharacterized membrane protein YfcA